MPVIEGPFNLTPGTPVVIGPVPTRHPTRRYLAVVMNLSPYALSIDAGLNAFVPPWQIGPVWSSPGAADFTATPALVGSIPASGVTTVMLLTFYSPAEQVPAGKAVVVGLTPPIVTVSGP